MQTNCTYMTGFGKTNHFVTFIVLRNINLKNSHSYNSAILSISPYLQLRIFAVQRGLIVIDSLLSLILKGFYWHGYNIRSDTYKGWVITGIQLEKTPRGTPRSSQKMKLMSESCKGNIWTPRSKILDSLEIFYPPLKTGILMQSYRQHAM